MNDRLLSFYILFSLQNSLVGVKGISFFIWLLWGKADFMILDLHCHVFNHTIADKVRKTVLVMVGESPRTSCSSLKVLAAKKAS